ncbi:DUF2177 family protein [Anatilimnocola floriformis]|uniref:DUF2177 family protein n=1 Tax=Anatilimnocola floriformis TaxID=2948575 RepID=UPI0020C5800C|nr:DUF2177 family protein [Anatilimnocola floriformis]
MFSWKAFLVLLPIFAIIDLTYLGFVMKWFYDREIGELARRASNGALAPRWIAAVIVYVLIPLGIMVFVRPHVAATDSVLIALMWGAVYGLVVYGVYDFTNRATLEKWSLQLALADVLWGCVLCGTTAAISHWLTPPPG